MKANSNRSGYVLVYLAVVIATVSILVGVASTRRIYRVREARSAYMESSALVLAQSGIESALVSRSLGLPTPQHPLGEQIELTAATGLLQVTVFGPYFNQTVTSCAEVRSVGARASRDSVRRCIDVVVRGGLTTDVVSWVEY